MLVIFKLKLLLSFLLLVGCGSSDGYVAVTAPRGPVSVSTPIPAAEGGTVTHPETGHSVVLSPGALSKDALVTLSVVNSDAPTAAGEQEFDPAGLGFRLELESGTSLVGEVRFVVPHARESAQHQRLYWHLSEGLVVPLASEYDVSRAVFTGTLDLASADGLTQPQEAGAELRPSSITVRVH